MKTLTIDFGAWLTKVKAALPAEFAPLVDSMAGAMEGWARTQLEAWYALATCDPDAAKAQLLAAMSEAGLTAQIAADGARIDADVAANADAMASLSAASFFASAAGCSGLQVKGDFAPTMATDAAAAQGIVAAAAAGDLEPRVARAYLAGPALALNSYYCAATVNLLEFWFTQEKRIFVSAQFYNDLRAAALGAAEAAKRAETCPDADAVARASRLAQDIVAFDKARRGVR